MCFIGKWNKFENIEILDQGDDYSKGLISEMIFVKLHRNVVCVVYFYGM